MGRLVAPSRWDVNEYVPATPVGRTHSDQTPSENVAPTHTSAPLGSVTDTDEPSDGAFHNKNTPQSEQNRPSDPTNTDGVAGGFTTGSHTATRSTFSATKKRRLPSLGSINDGNVRTVSGVATFAQPLNVKPGRVQSLAPGTYPYPTNIFIHSASRRVPPSAHTPPLGSNSARHNDTGPDDTEEVEPFVELSIVSVDIGA